MAETGSKSLYHFTYCAVVSRAAEVKSAGEVDQNALFVPSARLTMAAVKV
jgi:hypothetical protein